MTNRFKIGLLAATAVVATSAAAAPAAIERAAPIEHAYAEIAPTTPIPARKTGLIAAAAATLAALAGAIGWRRIRAALAVAAPTVTTAARAMAAAPAQAAVAVRRAISSPLRQVAILAAVGMFLLAGFGLYDVEWAGGVLAGAIAIILTRRSWRPSPLAHAGRRSGVINQRKTNG